MLLDTCANQSIETNISLEIFVLINVFILPWQFCETCPRYVPESSISSEGRNDRYALQQMIFRSRQNENKSVHFYTT